MAGRADVGAFRRESAETFARSFARWDEALSLYCCGNDAGGGAAQSLEADALEPVLARSMDGLPAAKPLDGFLARIAREFSRLRAAPLTRGATAELVAAGLERGSARFARVGLCRAYRLRGGELARLMPEEPLGDDGIVVSALGADEPGWDLVDSDLASGDVFVLCTGVVARAAPHETFFRLVRDAVAASDLSAAAERLWNSCRARLSSDSDLARFDSRAAVLLIRPREQEPGAGPGPA